jgi:hypothetical protein
MSIIQLKHYENLAYGGSGKNNLMPLPDDIVAMAANATVVTFRPLRTGRADKVLKNVHACVRLDKLPDTNLVFYSVESDSPLSPLLIWDAVHFMSVGKTITLAGDHVNESYLLRSYYTGSLKVEKHNDNEIVLRKVAPLPAEKDVGKNAWTFGIPVGPEDATILNVVVRRILELDLPTKEILLCGRPGKNFHYWDKVKIIGEDITAPPVQICAKKNRLVQEASHENICILHDRVFLPKNFDKAIDNFGEFYSFTTFCSIYFDDRFNLVPRRYSDYNIAPKISAVESLGVMRNNDISATSAVSPSVLPLTEGEGFYYGNALRYDTSSYLTGSLYLVKRSVWLLCPQNENLVWSEFEDLDQGMRAEAMGIPSRINPHAITQSLVGRPLLSLYGIIFYESLNGILRQYRSKFEYTTINRKPLIKILNKQVLDNLSKFMNKYVPDHISIPIPSNAPLKTNFRIKSLIQVTNRIKIPINRKSLVELILDYEKLLVIDQLPYSKREYLLMQFLESGNKAVKGLVFECDQLINQASQRPKKSAFVTSFNDYLPRFGIIVFIGSFISAILLILSNRQAFYFPGGLIGCYRCIINTTPFSYYAKLIK